MDREFRIAIALVGLIAAWVVALVLLVRYAVPMILEARFTGAMFVAVVVGVRGLLVGVLVSMRIAMLVGVRGLRPVIAQRDRQIPPGVVAVEPEAQPAA